MRPETYGPRSTTGTVRVTPCERKVTSVPHGRERWATPSSVRVRVLPQAVPCPISPGPYHEISGSVCHGFLLTDPGLASGWAASGRALGGSVRSDGSRRIEP